MLVPHSGLLLGAPQLARVLTSMAWGSWSDRHGRIPVVRIGLGANMLLSIAFAFCPSFWLAVLIRFVAGALDFVWGSIRTLASESFPQVRQARVISSLSAAFGGACVLGPAAGGLLSRPALKYPEVVGTDGIFGAYPYLLPLLTNAIISLFALLTTLWLPETAGPRCQQRYAAVAAAEQEDLAANRQGVPRGFRAFCVTPISLVVLCLTLTEFFEFADMALQPLWASAPSASGGLGFSSSEVGLLMAASGMLCMITLVVAYPRLDKLMGPVRTLRLVSASYFTLRT
jgi:MFS family permease